ncbi:MAG: DNA primase, partial [Ferruginibacter sp.]
KTEEFTRRQDYIKQVSEILKIGEDGLNALVNKLIRDKISKEENRSYRNDPIDNAGISFNAGNEGDEVLNLFNKDEMNERAMIRSLLEFGIKDWDEKHTVAEYLFAQVKENELDAMMENKELVNIYEIYKTWYSEGLKPTAKTFLYHEDREINTLVINIMDVNTDISPNWKQHFEGHIPTREDLFKEEVISTLTYLKLRKIKKMIDENQREMEHAVTSDEQMLFLQTHQHLKQMEVELTRQVGTVIFK